jgi:hypothetical protein
MFHWILGLVAAFSLAQSPAGTMAFTVSMDQPSTHYYHVEFRSIGLHGDSQDFKLPVWMPDYYRIMDYSKDVINFKAVDGVGHPLLWAKTTKNTWHVNTGNAFNALTIWADLIWLRVRPAFDPIRDDPHLYRFAHN